MCQEEKVSHHVAVSDLRLSHSL